MDRFLLMPAFFLVLAFLVASATAQVATFGQCGGIGYSGSTTCVTGSTCTVQNPYFSQCLPASTGAAPTSVSAPASTGTATPAPPSKANFWFSFGDSYTQTGFNVTTGPLPSVGNPLGNPPYPGFTAVGGENWIDFDTTTNNNSLVFTYNFAYGGATIDASLVTPFEPTVLSVTDQVNEFLNSVASKPPSTPWTSANSLFSIWIGINDLGNSYFEPGNRTANVGARNFLFINVPPTDRSPLMLAQSTDAQALLKSVILDFNNQLAGQAQTFKASHSGVTTFLWDSNADFTTILNNPQAFGFNDATTFGSGPGIFWGNNLHPSSAANKFFAQDVAQVLKGTVW